MTHQNKHNKHFTQKMNSLQEPSTNEKTTTSPPLQPPPEESYSREAELAMEVESLKLEMEALKKRLDLTEKTLAVQRRVKRGQSATRPRRSTGQQWGSPFRVELPDEMWLEILGHLPITCLKEVRGVSTQLGALAEGLITSSVSPSDLKLFSRIPAFTKIEGRGRLWAALDLSERMSAVRLQKSRMALFLEKSPYLRRAGNSIRYPVVDRVYSRITDEKKALLVLDAKLSKLRVGYRPLPYDYFLGGLRPL